jgi:hypothetical protein
MNYDIIVKGFRTKGARMVIARHLTREAGVPLPRALAMTEQLPLTLFRAISRENVASTLERYGKLGIDIEAIEAMPVAEKSVYQHDDLLPSVASLQMARSGRHDLTVPTRKRSAPAEGMPLTPPPQQPSAGPREKPAMRLIKNIAVLAALLSLIVVTLFYLYRAPGSRTVPAIDSSIAASSSGVKKKNKEPLPAAAPAKKALAQRYVDSAKAMTGDTEAAIHFYKMAIAFNRRNVNAWYGLLDAYHRSGREGEEKTTKTAMQTLFGDAIVSIERIVRPFGELTECNRSKGGTLSLEYRTKAPGARDKLLKETYLVARALSTLCDYSTLSIFASTSASQGLMVHCSAHEGFSSVVEFEKKATIYFFGTPKNGSETIKDR